MNKIRSGMFGARCPGCGEVRHRTRYPSAPTTIISPHRKPGTSAWGHDACSDSDGARVAWLELALRDARLT